MNIVRGMAVLFGWVDNHTSGITLEIHQNLEWLYFSATGLPIKSW